MVEDKGVSFLIITRDPSVNLPAQLDVMNKVCKELGYGCEIILFHDRSNAMLENILDVVPNVRLVKHKAINFRSSALRTGLKSARYERLVLCLSGDITTVPSIKQMIIGLEYYDLICGIRPVLSRGIRATIYRWFWHKLVRLLFDVRLRDINCPYKALLRSKMAQVGYLESEGSLTHTELIARAHTIGMKVSEFPLDIFHLESQRFKTYGVSVLAGTFYRIIKLKVQIGRTKRRLADEACFHNAWASTMEVSRLLVRESFEAVTAEENKYALETMGDIEGKSILDLGCGAGESSVYFALKGARVTAVDVSKEMLHVATELAKQWDVTIDTRLMIAEDMDLPSDSFDYVYGNGVLHHVDRKKAYNEIYRILKPGGQAIFIEPLCYNPIISVYRIIARSVRTRGEKPFRFHDFRYLRQMFPYVKHTEFWLATQLVFVYFFLVRRINPRKERYWKKVIADAEKLAPMYTRLLKIDNFLLTRARFLRRFCWNTVIILRKTLPQSSG